MSALGLFVVWRWEAVGDCRLDIGGSGEVGFGNPEGSVSDLVLDLSPESVQAVAESARDEGWTDEIVDRAGDPWSVGSAARQGDSCGVALWLDVDLSDDAGTRYRGGVVRDHVSEWCERENGLRGDGVLAVVAGEDRSFGDPPRLSLAGFLAVYAVEQRSVSWLEKECPGDPVGYG